MTLTQYITDRLHRPFEWGSNDCCTFVNGWLLERHGIDYLEGLRGWTSERTAARVLRRLGGLEVAMDDRFGRVEVPFAVDGSIGLIRSGLALFTGVYLVAPGPEGLVFVSREEATCAWSV
jgi:hypothetical protein